ncbi:MAG TPA: hypothetical protein VLF18_07250 [Tahibacter sp.]|uniref:hypothetical protein n=1 Tax=Tahibacter sp. TaxID=2056211 RepID=UPI002C07F309|nr:hypothetical protein [Tahibacter sp.]HSX59976.1 hypothetical protein [Tahibacter sp.]
MHGDALVAAIVAVALANRLLLAAPGTALPPLRAIALHGVLAALVATVTTLATAALHDTLAPRIAPYPAGFLVVPVGAASTALAAVLLPRWRTSLRDTDWRLLGADAIALTVIAGFTGGDTASTLLRGFACASAFAFALVVLCALERRLQHGSIPDAFRGLPIQLLNAGMLVLAGSGIVGLFGT